MISKELVNSIEYFAYFYNIFRKENEMSVIRKQRAKWLSDKSVTFLESLILAQDERWRRA